jgi:hypothetical protein
MEEYVREDTSQPNVKERERLRKSFYNRLPSVKERRNEYRRRYLQEHPEIRERVNATERFKRQQPGRMERGKLE